MEIVFCECGCGQSFSKYDSHGRLRRFISGHNSIRGHRKERIAVVCNYCGSTIYKLACQLRSEHHFCNTHCRAKWIGSVLSVDIDFKKKHRDIALKSGIKPPLKVGEDHWNWQGGIAVYNRDRVLDQDYVGWRKAVFYKDDYTCQICGTRGGKLSAHHIKEWAKYPELRLDINNGQCLCYDCHMELHGLNKKTA